MKRGLGGGRETREIIEVNEKREDMKEEGVGCCPEVRKDEMLRSILLVYLHGVMVDLGEHAGRKQ